MATINYTGKFIKDQRHAAGHTQEELAAKAGVGLRFLRELEQGKDTLKMEKVNQVLALFGYHLAPSKELDPYLIYNTYVDKPAKVYLKNKQLLAGIILTEIRENNEITAWQFINEKDTVEYKKTKNPELVTNILHRDIERIENY